jgi:chemotaxis protein MotB
MNNLKDSLQKALRQRSNFDKLKDHIAMTVTGEGLRIELLETNKGMFFENGQPKPTESGAELLKEIAKELGKLSNSIFIEGHTDSKPFDNSIYSNWELSADRANAARKLMEENGLRPNQVTQIRGYADQLLRVPERPEDPSNRRISIIVQYPPEASDPGPSASKSSSPDSKSSSPDSKPGPPASKPASAAPAQIAKH